MTLSNVSNVLPKHLDVDFLPTGVANHGERDVLFMPNFN